MGFFEKVKNMFTEEVEDDDVKVEQIKRESTKVSFEKPKENIESPKIDFNDEKTGEFEKIKDLDDVYKEDDLKQNKPIFFDDNDFKDLNFGSREEKKEEKVEIKEEVKEETPVYTRSSMYTKETYIPEEREPYGAKLEKEVIVEEQKIFKPTPIISPVYGVLDKNYHKEDIVSRSEVREPKISPIDSIRNKAYGTLEDELENTLFGTNSILFKKDETIENIDPNENGDNVLSNLTDDISKELDELLIKKEKYEPEDEEVPTRRSRITDDTDDEDLLGFIDSTLYKSGDEE